jgi:hypothetical protein
VTRAKCRYGPSHESVTLVDGEWRGEDSNDFGCVMAPSDPCPVCDGVDLSKTDEGFLVGATCPLCHGTGRVPGPHWPWRHDHPGPLKARGAELRQYRITHRATGVVPADDEATDPQPWVGPRQRTHVRGRSAKNWTRQELQREGHRIERVETRTGFWWW